MPKVAKIAKKSGLNETLNGRGGEGGGRVHYKKMFEIRRFFWQFWQLLDTLITYISIKLINIFNALWFTIKNTMIVNAPKKVA